MSPSTMARWRYHSRGYMEKLRKTIISDEIHMVDPVHMRQHS